MIYIRTYKQMETAAARFRRFMAELYDPHAHHDFIYGRNRAVDADYEVS